MPRIIVSMPVSAPIHRVWEHLINWPAHGAWIPFSTVTVTAPGAPDGTGTQFVGRTGLGPFAFNDPMTVTHLQPPALHPTVRRGGRPPVIASCEIAKTGTLIRGTAGFILERIDNETTHLQWWEDIEIGPRWTWWTALTGPAIQWAGQKAFTRALTKMASQL